MNATPFVFRHPPHDCPPTDWMAGGSCNPAAAEAYGFRESDVVQAVVDAYYEAFTACGGGCLRAGSAHGHAGRQASRDALRSALVGHFVDALEHLGV